MNADAYANVLMGERMKYTTIFENAQGRHQSTGEQFLTVSPVPEAHLAFVSALGIEHAYKLIAVYEVESRPIDRRPQVGILFRTQL